MRSMVGPNSTSIIAWFRRLSAISPISWWKVSAPWRTVSPVWSRCLCTRTSSSRRDDVTGVGVAGSRARGLALDAAARAQEVQQLLQGLDVRGPLEDPLAAVALVEPLHAAAPGLGQHTALGLSSRGSSCSSSRRNNRLTVDSLASMPAARSASAALREPSGVSDASIATSRRPLRR